jgi:NAD(P)H-hydrate repair Nnr-like enzyme with NAD(P)H-hydrate epimerase domain
MNLTNSKETQSSVALVGLGGAGMSILKKTIELTSAFDAFAVNYENWLENVNFYRFDQVDELILELEKYRHVILTAGLGSSGGDSLAYLANQLDNVSAIFITKPFKVEKTRLRRAEEQLRMIGGNANVKDLNELLIKNPESSIGIALDEIDRKIAMEIIRKIVSMGVIK